MTKSENKDDFHLVRLTQGREEKKWRKYYLTFVLFYFYFFVFLRIKKWKTEKT